MSTLREQVQSARDQAREVLRSKNINSLLQDLFYDNKCLSETTADLVNSTKRLRGCFF